MFIYVPDDLLIGRSGILKSPPITGLVVICDFNYSILFYLKSTAPDFSAFIFKCVKCLIAWLFPGLELVLVWSLLHQLHGYLHLLYSCYFCFTYPFPLCWCLSLKWVSVDYRNMGMLINPFSYHLIISFNWRILIVTLITESYVFIELITVSVCVTFIFLFHEQGK